VCEVINGEESSGMRLPLYILENKKILPYHENGARGSL
jgi:hypothetical protein